MYRGRSAVVFDADVAVEAGGRGLSRRNGRLPRLERKPLPRRGSHVHTRSRNPRKGWDQGAIPAWGGSVLGTNGIRPKRPDGGGAMARRWRQSVARSHKYRCDRIFTAARRPTRVGGATMITWMRGGKRSAPPSLPSVAGSSPRR